MKKFLLYTLSLAFCCIVLNSYAQQTDKYAKLKKLYVEHKFEACLTKAEKYISNEKTKKEPIPYLYLAKSYYELSLSEDPDIQEYYPKALKNALKYATKFEKKDKKGKYTGLGNDFIQKLIATYLEETKELYEAGKYNNVSANYKTLLKLRDDNNIRFAKGLCDAFRLNHAEANAEITTALSNLQNDAVVNGINNSKVVMINTGIDYTDYLLRNENVDTAFSTINVMLDIYPESASLKMQKDKISEWLTVSEEEE